MFDISTNRATHLEVIQFISIPADENIPEQAFKNNQLMYPDRLVMSFGCVRISIMIKFDDSFFLWFDIPALNDENVSNKTKHLFHFSCKFSLFVFSYVVHFLFEPSNILSNYVGNAFSNFEKIGAQKNGFNGKGS